jgi:Sulfotransferase family
MTSRGNAYRFQELLQPLQDAPVPPLVFLHVPKTGGTTLNRILMRNFRYRLDSYGDSFFPRYQPEEIAFLANPPQGDDTRRPVFFTGHINVENAIFDHLPGRYVAITLLRDPVARIVSHYSLHSVLHPEAGLSLIDFFRKLYPPYHLQHEIFAPRSHSVADALETIENRLSLFGLQHRFDEFVVLLAHLLGLPDTLYVSANKRPPNAPPVTPAELEKLRAVLADEITFYDQAERLYQRRLEMMGGGFFDRVDAFRQANEQNMASRPSTHPWTRFY